MDGQARKTKIAIREHEPLHRRRDVEDPVRLVQALPGVAIMAFRATPR